MKTNSRLVARVMLAAVVFVSVTVGAQPQPVYLNEKELRTTLEDHTLIGQNWAEYYAADGTIKGKARQFGFVRNYEARWRVADDTVSYDYEGTAFDTASHLSLSGETVRHYTMTNAPKADGVARRVKGNQVASALQ